MHRTSDWIPTEQIDLKWLKAMDPRLHDKIIRKEKEGVKTAIRQCIIRAALEKPAEGKMEIPWQYFAALLPVRSVGVHGDVRAYGETIVVRAVQSMDGMSARYSEIPHSILQKISTRITNTVKGAANRVVYDITHKPPGTIEWE